MIPSQVLHFFVWYLSVRFKVLFNWRSQYVEEQSWYITDRPIAPRAMYSRPRIYREWRVGTDLAWRHEQYLANSKERPAKRDEMGRRIRSQIYRAAGTSPRERGCGDFSNSPIHSPVALRTRYTYKHGTRCPVDCWPQRNNPSCRSRRFSVNGNRYPSRYYASSN